MISYSHVTRVLYRWGFREKRLVVQHGFLATVKDTSASGGTFVIVASLPFGDCDVFSVEYRL